MWFTDILSALIILVALPRFFSQSLCSNAISLSEYNALYSFYNSTNGNDWNWKSVVEYGLKWNFDPDVEGGNASLSKPCTEHWQGLSCDFVIDSSNMCYVKSLALVDYNLTGSLPSDINGLSKLTSLSLSFNYLSSTIPRQLWDLGHLQDLSLNNNMISGPIRAEIGNVSTLLVLNLEFNFFTSTVPAQLSNSQSLQSLYLSTNSFSGFLSETLGHLPKLEYMTLNQNQLSGSIPISFQNLSSLTVLYLDVNYLTGTLHSFFGDMSSIEELNFGINQLSGALPSSLGECSLLSLLALNSNNFNSSIPSEWGRLKLLIDLGLNINELTGTIPSALSGLLSLQNIALDVNSLEGTIPSEFSNLRNIRKLYFQSNFLSGSLPSSFGELVILEDLQLNTNFLTSTIPSNIGGLSKLINLGLFSNQLSGTIPSAMGAMVQLIQFYLHDNSLTGTLPSTLGELSNLIFLLVDTNSLTGVIPTQIAQMSRLQSLHLYSNALTGSIPYQVANMSSLLELYLNNNLFTGPLNVLLDQYTPEVFKHMISLDISGNAFTGSFPSNFFLLRTLRILTLGSNCFSGEVLCPPTDVSSSSLEVLDINGLSSGLACRQYILPGVLANSGYYPIHFMEGEVPSCVWSLSNLTTLYSVGNGFGGNLDSISFDAPASSLVNVSLSYNQITGSVPAAFQTYGRFQHLDLSYNRFSGTLIPSFALASDSEVLVDTNRLSGQLPSSTNWTSMASIVENALNGNLFFFDPNALPVSEMAAAAPYSGSYDLDLAMAVSTIFVVTFLAIFLFFNFFVESRCCRLLKEHVVDVPSTTVGMLVQWWRVGSVSGMPGEEDTLDGSGTMTVKLYFENAHYILGCVSGSIVMFAFECLLFKVSPTLATRYSTYQFQYGWTLSVAFLHDIAPVVFILFAVFIVSVVLLHLARSEIIRKREELQDNTELRTWTVMKEKTRLFFTAVLATTAVFTVNAVVVVSINVLYLRAILGSSAYLVPIQVSVAFFKSFWNVTVLQSVLKQITVFSSSGGDGGMLNYFEDKLLSFEIGLMIFNFIIVPCIATSVTDTSCFYELFQQQPAPSVYYPATCPINSRIYLGPSPTDYTCASSQSVYSSAFFPPFVYSYQCGSALIVAYVPVLMYSFFVSGFLVPLFMTLACLNATGLAERLPEWLLRTAFPPIYLLDHVVTFRDIRTSHLDITEKRSRNYAGDGANDSTDSTNSSPYAVFHDSGNPSGDSQTGRKRQLFNVRSLAARLLLDVAVVLTFGLACPFLGVVAVCSLASEVAVWFLLIGRYRWEHIRANTILDSLGMGDSSAAAKLRSVPSLAAANAEIKATLQCFPRASYKNMWFIVVSAQVFWSLLCFDMIGDIYGYVSGIIAMSVTVLCLPLLTWSATTALWWSNFDSSRLHSVTSGSSLSNRASSSSSQLRRSIQNQLRSSDIELSSEPEIDDFRSGVDNLNSSFLTSRERSSVLGTQ